MRKILIVLMAVLITGVFAGYGYSHQQGGDGFDNPPGKEELRERIGMMRIWKLTEVLDLDEKTASRLFPVLHKFDKKRAEMHESAGKDKKELREALEEESYGQIKGILKRLERKHRELQELNEEEKAELRDILTIEQQAKFILFRHDFERRIKKIVAEAKERRFAKDRLEKPLLPEVKY
ncbi:hypothetical protein BMS3Bbin08_01994 [bacterium BMS3Bbin08]|nr:hypothetical protein BMS3Bbin08_01994 [bacterium BMS3Bbin08]